MKDIHIPGEVIRRELLIFIGCFLIAVVMNAGSIAYYQTNWIELITALDVTIVIACIMYVVFGIVRIFYGTILRLYQKIKTK